MKWIPTSERLPSERGEYLVTVFCDGDAYVDCLYYGKPLMANREVNGECFYESDDEWGDVVYEKREITAWMPLPEPYHNDEPQTEEWHDDCNTCGWHDGACTIPCCDYEPQTDKEIILDPSFAELSDEQFVEAMKLIVPQTDCSWK